MVELTNEILEANGFETNHPERLMKKYYKTEDAPEKHITVEQVYIPQLNTTGYDVICEIYNKDGLQTHYSRNKFIRTVEELNMIFEINDYNFKISA